MNIGDVVVLVGSYEQPDSGASLLHRTGVVKSIDRVGRVGVEFDQPFPGGHNLNGRGKTGYCWWVPSQSLERMLPIREVLKAQ